MSIPFQNSAVLDAAEKVVKTYLNARQEQWDEDKWGALDQSAFVELQRLLDLRRSLVGLPPIEEEETP